MYSIAAVGKLAIVDRVDSDSPFLFFHTVNGGKEFCTEAAADPMHEYDSPGFWWWRCCELVFMICCEGCSRIIAEVDEVLDWSTCSSEFGVIRAWCCAAVGGGGGSVCWYGIVCGTRLIECALLILVVCFSLGIITISLDATRRCCDSCCWGRGDFSDFSLMVGMRVSKLVVVHALFLLFFRLGAETVAISVSTTASFPLCILVLDHLMGDARVALYLQLKWPRIERMSVIWCRPLYLWILTSDSVWQFASPPGYDSRS